MTMKKVENGRPNKSMTQNLGNTTMNSFNDRDISNNSFVSSGTNRLGPSKSLAVLEMMKHSQQNQLSDTIKPRAQINLKVEDKDGSTSIAKKPPLFPGMGDTPVYIEPPVKKRFSVNQGRTFDDNCLLINPNIDASDKELHARNGYKTASKNLVSFLQNGDQALFMKNVVRPTSFGQLSKDNLGTTKSVGGYEYKPKFRKKHNSIDQM